MLELLRESPDLTLGKTHYSIKALIEAGWVSAEPFAKSDKKAGYLYVLTPAGIGQRPALAASLLERKCTEYDVLAVEMNALESKDIDQSESSTHTRNESSTHTRK